MGLVEWTVWSSLLVVATYPEVVAQSSGPGCPLEWISHGDRCYLFVFDKTKTYAESASACWVDGSALISINSVDENNYISAFLASHARERATVWYTSGQYISGSIKWYGDGTYTNKTAGTNVWHNIANPDQTDDRIVYRYSAQYQTFKWNRVSGLEQLNYICEIPKSEVFRIVQQKRGFDYGVNSTDKSAIKKGPTFLLQPESIVVVGGDLPAQLECSADGNPQPAYKWYGTSTDYNRQNFGTTTEIFTSTDSRYSLTNGRLVISDPDETKDAGSYQCQAENQLGSILSEPISLSFGYLNQYSPNPPGAVEAKRNQGTFINCLAPSAKPALSYGWYKGSVLNFVRPELDKYYFISANGNLYLSEVQDSAAGSYFCVVTLISPPGAKLSTLQPPSRTSKAIQLVVKNSPAQEYGPIIHPDFINVYPKPPLAGHEVRMECFAYGRTPLRYSWFREGQQFPEGTYFKYDNRVLVIPQAELSASGNYTCKVEKMAGVQRVVFKSFVLTVEAKPYFVVPLRHVHADVDSELTWRCEVEAVPSATYSWYKNSRLLQRVPGEIEIRENVLLIKRLGADRDNGMYQCLATNPHGTSVSTAQLRVLSFKPSFAKFPLPSTTVTAIGGNLTIRCTPEAAPAPDTAWLHNNQQIGYNDGRTEILLDGTLHVTKVTTNDAGRYTCKASNVNGEDQSTTEVSVYSGIRFLRSPVDTVGGVNKTLFLSCEISYDLSRFDLTYVWRFNGRVINTRNDYFYRLGDRLTPGLYIVNTQFRHSGLYECVGETVSTSIASAARVTVIGPPGEPAGVFVQGHAVQNGSLRLEWTWNPYSNHGFPVKRFHVEAQTEFSPTWSTLMTGGGGGGYSCPLDCLVEKNCGETLTISYIDSGFDIPETLTVIPNQDMKRYVYVHNLLPYNSYQFRVRAINDLGVGAASKHSEIYRIPAAAPIVVPKGVGGGGGAVGLLCMSWQPLGLEEEGGKNFGYIVYWKLASDDKMKPKQKDVGNVTSHCETVGVKNYYTMYAVQVQAYNSIGKGPISPTGFVYSAEGMPAIRPTNVNYNTINATAITVYWNKVPSTREAIKGKVLGYRIDYWDANNPNGQSNSKFVYCDCGEGLVVGLDPDSDYWVRVAVFNSAGTGVPSEKYLTSTNQYPAALYPQFVEVLPHGEHSAKVKWRGVSTKLNEGALKGYKLMYWPVGDDIRTANFTKTDKRTNTVIYGLQMDIIYKLRAMAVNLGGDGKKSPTVYFTILKGGAININRASFDPTTSQTLMAGASPTHHRHILIFLAYIVYTLTQVQ